jgi:hypothetical protein
MNFDRRGRIYVVTPQLVSGKHGEVSTRVCKLPVDSIVIMRLSSGYLMIDHGESYDIVMMTENIYEINAYLKETYGIEVVSDE